MGRSQDPGLPGASWNLAGWSTEEKQLPPVIPPGADLNGGGIVQLLSSRPPPPGPHPLETGWQESLGNAARRHQPHATQTGRYLRMEAQDWPVTICA